MVRFSRSDNAYSLPQLFPTHNLQDLLTIFEISETDSDFLVQQFLQFRF